MDEYRRPTRSPEELFSSDLPDWAVRVWMVVRARQGANDEAWAFYEDYAAQANKSEGMVRKAIGLLKREGWMEEVSPARRGAAPHLRCHVPEGLKRSEQGSSKGENPVPKGENVVPTQPEKVRTTFQKGENHIPERSEQGSQPPTPPYKEESVQESVKESVQRSSAKGTDKGPTLEQVLERAAMAGVPKEQATEFYYHYDAEGWTVNGRPIHKWESKLMQWKNRQHQFARSAKGTPALSADPTARVTGEDALTALLSTHPLLRRGHFAQQGFDGRERTPVYQLRPEHHHLVTVSA